MYFHVGFIYILPLSLAHTAVNVASSPAMPAVANSQADDKSANENAEIGTKVPAGELPESARRVEHIEHIENWANLHRTGVPQGVVRTQPFKVGGFDWRLMLFPRGTHNLRSIVPFTAMHRSVSLESRMT